jgi:enoyl-CoA hydratase/carnithine racemase
VSTRLLSTSQGRLQILCLDSDDGLPRLERSVLAQLEAAIARIARESDIAGCVITGTERGFAVGADISELARLTPTKAHEFSREGQRVCGSIARSRVPVVAAIRGYCMGGGLDLALACRARVATPDAIFAHPGGSLGILTGWGGTQRLTRLIGRARALEMLATGRNLNATEALFGLIDRIVPPSELLAAAEALAVPVRGPGGFPGQGAFHSG